MKKGISTILAVCITVFVMLAMAGGGWYYMDKTTREAKKASDDRIAVLEKQVATLQKSIDSTSTVSTNTTTTNTAATDSAAAEWRTYSNSSFGFTIKYPSDWTAVDTLQIPGKESTTSQSLKISTTDATITMYIDPTGWGGPAPEITYSGRILSNKLVLSDRKVVPPLADGEDGIAPDPGQIALLQDSSMALNHNSHGYYISAVNPGLQKENIIVQILSSLEFVS